jgi:hypothetical protein
VFGKDPPARVKVAIALICSVVVDAEEEAGEDEGGTPRASQLWLPLPLSSRLGSITLNPYHRLREEC